MSAVASAFMVIWVALFAYMLVWQRQVRDLRAEVQALRALAQRQPTP